MARPAPPTDTIRVALSGSIFTHRFNNIFWLLVTSSGPRTTNDLAAMLDGVIAAYSAQFLNKLGNDVSGLTADGVWQTSPTTSLADTRTAAHAGSGGVTVDEAGACVVVSWKIAARYRGGKPRTYLPGPVTADVANGSTLGATPRTNLAAAAVGFNTAINALTSTNISGCQLGTVSFFTAGGSETLPPTYRTPPVFEPYIGSGVRATIGSQRRRITA